MAKTAQLRFREQRIEFKILGVMSYLWGESLERKETHFFLYTPMSFLNIL